jgi:hypothetical protein
MNQTIISQLLGTLKDDTGQISSMRVLLLIGSLAILSPSIYLAYKTGQAPVFTNQQLGLVAALLAAKLWQNSQENTFTPLPLPKT